MRYCGVLDIGHPLYAGGVFACVMTYRNHNRTIDEDELISAVQEVRRQFLQLLHQNGFLTYSMPEVQSEWLSDKVIKIHIEAQASRAKPEKIVIESLKNN